MKKIEFDEKDFKLVIYEKIINAIIPYINEVANELKKKEIELKKRK